MNSRAFDREFLCRLAPIWLACRFRLMGGKLIGKHWPRPNMENDLLGCMDYAAEMRLVLIEVINDAA